MNIFHGNADSELCLVAPEIFGEERYTAAVDVWSLGVTIAWLVSGGFPQGYRGDEGLRWCEALVEHFGKYRERKSKEPGYEFDEGNWDRCLNNLVGERMLRIKPEDRRSAPDCLELGDFLWHLLSDQRDNINNTLPRESGVLEEIGSEGEGGNESDENDSCGGDDTSEDDHSEAETERPKAGAVVSDEWMALEEQFPIGEEIEASPEALRYLADAPSLKPSTKRKRSSLSESEEKSKVKKLSSDGDATESSESEEE